MTIVTEIAIVIDILKPELQLEVSHAPPGVTLMACSLNPEPPSPRPLGSIHM
jgi:hypothetical protein